jgi:hypothetical protein
VCRMLFVNRQFAAGVTVHVTRTDEQQLPKQEAPPGPIRRQSRRLFYTADSAAEGVYM